MAIAHEEEGNLSDAMDETIRNTLAEIRSRNTDAETAEIIAKEPPKTEVPAEPKEEPAKAEPEQRARDEEGKFIKGQQKRHTPASTPQKTPPAQAEPPAKEPTQALEPAAAEPETPELKFGAVTVDLKRPPSSWKPAAKAVWNSLPDTVKAEVYRRETDFSNSVLNGPMKQNADFGQSVKQIVEPYIPLIESEGGTPEKAIGDLLKTAALFRSSNQGAKLNALFQLDSQFNAGLRQHFQQSVQNEIARLTGGQTGQVPAQPQGQPQTFMDPRVDQIMQSLQQQERTRMEEQERIANSATDSFLASKNEKGEPLFPFVDNVIDDMTDRVGAIRKMNPAMAHNDVLKQAYDAAVWANPETRAVLISQTQAEQTAAAQTAQRAAQAKRATVGAMPKRGAIPATEPAKTLEDTIRDTARELGMF